jgi:hypothetical protein
MSNAFLADYDVDLDAFEAGGGGFDIPDGTYDFEITNAEVRKGTKRDENAVHIVVAQRLENADGEVHSHQDWFAVPVDMDHLSPREKMSMQEWKLLLVQSGMAPADTGKATPDDIEGRTGTLRLVSTNGKGKNSDKVYQNVKDRTFDGQEEGAPVKAAPAKARKAAAPVEDAEEADEAPRRTAKKANPFAKD